MIRVTPLSCQYVSVNGDSPAPNRLLSKASGFLPALGQPPLRLKNATEARHVHRNSREVGAD